MKEFLAIIIIAILVFSGMALLIGGAFYASRVSGETRKNNYFECLQKTDQKTCNAIFYQYKTKDLWE